MKIKREASSRAAGAIAAFGFALCAALGTAQPAQAATLDAANLLQGEYTVQASMVNATTKQDSIANRALANPVKLSVNAKHEYAVSMGMNPISMMGATAYMKSLSYWDGKTAAGQKEYLAATVTSTYDVTDRYGSGYPKELSFPLLNKAAGDEDGYVDLQVTVPIIPVNGGVQPVLMKIDWTSIQQTKVLEAVSGKVTYAVSGKGATVRSIDKKAKSITVKSKVKIGDKSYKVTSIAKKAAYKAKGLRKVSLGKNLKRIGKNAFKGIAKGAVFKAPKSKVRAYQKLIKKAGAPAKATVKAA